MTRPHRREFRRTHAGYCCYCGVLLCHEHRKAQEDPCPREASWDHVVPGLHGQGIVGREKVVACRRCNGDRGSRTIAGWKRDLEQRLEEEELEGLERAWALAVLAGLRWVK